MTNIAQSSLRAPPIAPLAAAKRFGRYKSEEEHAVRAPPATKKDKRLNGLLEAFVKYLVKNNPLRDAENAYGLAHSLVARQRYSSRDAENFSAMFVELLRQLHERRNFHIGRAARLPENDEDFGVDAGIFLSALINNCGERPITLHMRPPNLHPWYLGYKNSRDVLVMGDLGESTAMQMEGGTMVVEGNSDQDTGGRMKGGSLIIRGNTYDVGNCMEGGAILVEGNALNIGAPAHLFPSAGEGMKGGKIIIRGDAPGSVGQNMEGGEIHIGGEIGELGDAKGGRIYQRGRLVFPKGG